MYEYIYCNTRKCHIVAYMLKTCMTHKVRISYSLGSFHSKHFSSSNSYLEALIVLLVLVLVTSLKLKIVY